MQTCLTLYHLIQTLGKKPASMSNSLNIWHQLDRYPAEMYVKSLQDNSDGLKIFLHDITNTINFSIVFTEVLSYRNTDESYLLKLWDSYEEGVLKGSFFMYRESDFINYFNEMTYGIHKELAIKHYAIFTDSDCIEVLSVKEPLIVQDI
jgi:hypothetical protein